MTKEDGSQVLDGLPRRIDDLDLPHPGAAQRAHAHRRGNRARQAVSSDLPIYEPRREDEVFENVTGHNHGPLTADGVKRVFERIIDEMRNVQRLRMLEKDGSKGGQ